MSVATRQPFENGQHTWLQYEVKKGEEEVKVNADTIGVITDEMIYENVAKFDVVAQLLHAVSSKLFSKYINSRTALMVDYGSGKPSMRICYRTFSGKVLMSALKIEASFGKGQWATQWVREENVKLKEKGGNSTAKTIDDFEKPNDPKQMAMAEKGFTEEIQAKNPTRTIWGGATAWIRVEQSEKEDSEYVMFGVAQRKAYLESQADVPLAGGGRYTFRVVAQRGESTNGYASLIQIYTDRPELLKGATLATVDSYESGNASGQGNSTPVQQQPFGARTTEAMLKAKNATVVSVQQELMRRYDVDMLPADGAARQANCSGGHLFALNKNDGVSQLLSYRQPKMKNGVQENDKKTGQPAFENVWPNDAIEIDGVIDALQQCITTRTADLNSSDKKAAALKDLAGLLSTHAMLVTAKRKRNTTTVRIAEFNLGGGETIKSTHYLGAFVLMTQAKTCLSKALDVALTPFRWSARKIENRQARNAAMAEARQAAAAQARQVKPAQA